MWSNYIYLSTAHMHRCVSYHLNYKIFTLSFVKGTFSANLSWDLQKSVKRFTYADQNHTYSNLLHLIYRIANYLELRHVVPNSGRETVYPTNLQYFSWTI